jgi:hypothetical protein
VISGWWQTDPRLHPTIQKYGCAFLCSCYLSPQDFTPEEVNEIFRNMKLVNFLSDSCLIQSWDQVLWSISPVLRLKFKTSSRDYVCGPYEREIIKWWLVNVKENHFTVGDGCSRTEWDSMNRPDIMGSFASFVEKIIVKVGG